MGKRWLNRVFELAKSLGKKIKGGGALAEQLQEEVDVFARDVFTSDFDRFDDRRVVLSRRVARHIIIYRGRYKASAISVAC